MVNCGIGDAAQNNKGLDAAINDMALITGQRPVKTKAKNAIATFKIRENQTLGIAVTLRGNVSFLFSIKESAEELLLVLLKKSVKITLLELSSPFIFHCHQSC